MSDQPKKVDDTDNLAALVFHKHKDLALDLDGAAFYEFDSANSDAHDGDETVKPTNVDSGDPGRWKKLAVGGGGGGGSGGSGVAPFFNALVIFVFGTGNVIENLFGMAQDFFPNVKARVALRLATTLAYISARVELSTGSPGAFDGDLIITVYKNGAPTALTLTYAAGETGEKFFAAAVSYAPGDNLTFVYDTTDCTSGAMQVSTFAG